MKILFILPADTFGTDGIADYTSRLANYCENLGHSTCVVATGKNDWFFRARKMRESFNRIDNTITHFAPDIISWQFDPSMFDARGIFSTHVVPDFTKRANMVQMMVHETWEYNPSQLKTRLKSLLQRYSVSRAIKKISPTILHTSNPFYLSQLQHVGLKPQLLPIFSNIPVVRTASFVQRDYDANEWSFVIFGGLRPEWNSRSLMDILKATGRSINIHLVGRNTNSKQKAALHDNCKDWANLVDHGERSANEISELMLSSHFGISAYNLLHLRKSGVYAAFVDHGLPVIVPRVDSISMTGDSLSAEIPEGVIVLSDLPGALYEAKRHPLVDSLDVTGSRFIQSVERHFAR